MEFPGTVVGKNPKGFSTGRPSGALVWIVIHSTEGSETTQSAEDGNAYDAIRGDSVSTHVFVDSNSVVQEVNSYNRAWAAREVANDRGYQIELCGKAGQTAAQWSDSASGMTLLLAAQHAARVCLKYGIPARWGTLSDAQNFRPCFLTHADVSRWIAGTHTDPGAGFPREFFMKLVSTWISIYAPPVPLPPVKEEVMARLVRVAGDPAFYLAYTADSGRVLEHVVDPDELPALRAAYGVEVSVPSLFGLGTLKTKLSSPGIDSEH